MHVPFETVFVIDCVLSFLNLASEGGGARDHQERSGPRLPEPSEGLRSRGPRRSRQQSQRCLNMSEHLHCSPPFCSFSKNM